VPKPRARANGEGSVYASGKRWVADIPLPGGKRQRRSAETASAARALLREMLAARDRPPAVRTDQTLGAYLDSWLADIVKPNRKPRTYDKYEASLRLHVRPGLGNVKLVDLSGSDLRRLYADRQKAGLRRTTVNGVHLILHAALALAVREQLIERNPADHVQPPKPEEFEPAPLTLRDATKVLTMLREHRHGPLWAFLLGTGLRIGEALGLSWADVDPDGAVALVRHALSRYSEPTEDGGRRWVREIESTKSRRSVRALPLPPFAVDALRRQRDAVVVLQAATKRWQDYDLVFPSVRGTPLRPDHVLDLFKAALVSIGVEPRRLHDLRHSLAGLLLDSESADLATVSRLLGHADLATTDAVYAGRLTGAQRAAVARLGTLLEGPEEAS